MNCIMHERFLPFFMPPIKGAFESAPAFFVQSPVEASVTKDISSPFECLQEKKGTLKPSIKKGNQSAFGDPISELCLFIINT